MGNDDHRESERDEVAAQIKAVRSDGRLDVAFVLSPVPCPPGPQLLPGRGFITEMQPVLGGAETRQIPSRARLL